MNYKKYLKTGENLSNYAKRRLFGRTKKEDDLSSSETDEYNSYDDTSAEKVNEN